ncbi:MAG: chemotaxis-specific protein-glutamate methyltransferase CheB, partial [Alphaproteobacteria bacterium]
MKSAPATGGPYRVMVVDDSAVIRGFLTRYLEEDPAIKVVSSASNGVMALKNLARTPVDVVVLDIEMPEMDGMTALPKIREQDPTVKVVMASTLTKKNAEISLRALQLGASDYVPKPETLRAVNASLDFRRELVEKVKIYAAQRRREQGIPQPEGLNSSGQPRAATARTAAPVRSAGTGRRAPVVVVARGRQKELPVAEPETPARGDRIVLREPSLFPPEVLAIGSSTGGPQALMKLLGAMDRRRLSAVPIAIVQHMPPTFTGILAEHLGRVSGLPAVEATDRMPFEKGRIHVAPGDYHMVVERDEKGAVLRLNQDPPENFCRPAVDPLFRSLARTYAARTLAVVLTGMGHDGLRGAR